MRNIRTENFSENSLQVAFVAHALVVIKNRLFGSNLNAEHIVLLAMYHDASEVLTGDMPTSIKYFNEQIAHEYKNIEKIDQQKLINMVPEALRDEERILSARRKVTNETSGCLMRLPETFSRSFCWQ